MRCSAGRHPGKPEEGAELSGAEPQAGCADVRVQRERWQVARDMPQRGRQLCPQARGISSQAGVWVFLPIGSESMSCV